LRRTDADRTRQHDDLVRRFDILHRLINSPAVEIDPGEYRHG